MKKAILVYLGFWAILLIGALSVIFFFQDQSMGKDEIEGVFQIPADVVSTVYGKYQENYLYYLTEVSLRLEFDWESFDPKVMEDIDAEISFEDLKMRCRYEEGYRFVYQILEAGYGGVQKFFIPTVFHQTLVWEPDPTSPDGGAWGSATQYYIYKCAINDDYGAGRSYGGDRKHLGNDIMAEKGVPLVSVSSGVVTNLGWNELGGNRVGITYTPSSPSSELLGQISNPYKVYYYYAHMERINPNLKEGATVKPGDLIGFIGDSGYGIDGTTGKFAPHLHFQIGLIGGDFDEYMWLDPNAIIQMRKDKVVEVKIEDIYDALEIYLQMGSFGPTSKLRSVEENAEHRKAH